MARIAIPLASGFEDSEFTVPFDRLKHAHHKITVFGPRAAQVVTGKERKASARTDKAAKDLELEEFDALVIPGGYSPDHLRIDEDVVDFVRRFYESGKPVAAICHGPQLLIEAEVVEGKHITSWPSIRKDLQNAGAKWVDRPLVVDGNLITSRKPDDLDAFCHEILRSLAHCATRKAA